MASGPRSSIVVDGLVNREVFVSFVEQMLMHEPRREVSW